eukprot:4206649-Alexandrium_andersonii.AAC.1
MTARQVAGQSVSGGPACQQCSGRALMCPPGQSGKACNEPHRSPHHPPDHPCTGRACAVGQSDIVAERAPVPA